jgi:hypothetical protein
MKIKCLFLTVIALLLLVVNGCNKDEFIGEEPGVNLKSSQLKMLPVEWDLHVLLTKFAFPDGHPTPIGGPIGGIVSHLGQLKEGSQWQAYRYIRDDEASPSTIDYGISGKLVAANGDELNLDIVGFIYHWGPVEAEWIGKMYFSGGTGRFENANGEADSNGWITRDENGIPFSLDMHISGNLSSVGSSKK